MADEELTRDEDLRRLLTDAIEVQLAALKAGISFWSEWIEHTSQFVQSATKTLSNITSEDQEAKDLLLELVDAGRASVRSLTEIPRHTAARFIEELDKFEKKKLEEGEEPAEEPTEPVTPEGSPSRKRATKKATTKKATAKKTTKKATRAPAKRAPARGKRKRVNRAKE